MSALGSNAEASGAFELPPDILQAWGARKEKIAEEADDAEKRRQKLEVGHRAVEVLTFIDVHGFFL